MVTSGSSAMRAGSLSPEALRGTASAGTVLGPVGVQSGLRTRPVRTANSDIRPACPRERAVAAPRTDSSRERDRHAPTVRDSRVQAADTPPARPLPDPLRTLTPTVAQAPERLAGESPELLAGVDGGAGTRGTLASVLGASAVAGSEAQKARLASQCRRQRDRLDAEAGDPARGRPDRLRQRVHHLQPRRHTGGLRPLGHSVQAMRATRSCRTSAW